MKGRDNLDSKFWAKADDLVVTSEIVLDRPKGSSHPRFPEKIYPLDYGYLSGTLAMDGGGIDIWLGSLPDRRVTGAVMTVDSGKRDAEVKLLIGCTAAEAELILATHNHMSQAGILVLRDGAAARPD